MQHDHPLRLLRAAAMSDSAASELSTDAVALEAQGNESSAQAVREQARSHRAEAIQLRALAAGEAYMRIPRPNRMDL